MTSENLTFSLDLSVPEEKRFIHPSLERAESGDGSYSFIARKIDMFVLESPEIINVKYTPGSFKMPIFYRENKSKKVFVEYITNPDDLEQLTDFFLDENLYRYFDVIVTDRLFIATSKRIAKDHGLFQEALEETSCYYDNGAFGLTIPEDPVLDLRHYGSIDIHLDEDYTKRPICLFVGVNDGKTPPAYYRGEFIYVPSKDEIYIYSYMEFRFCRAAISPSTKEKFLSDLNGFLAQGRVQRILIRNYVTGNEETIFTSMDSHASGFYPNSLNISNLMGTFTEIRIKEDDGYNQNEKIVVFSSGGRHKHGSVLLTVGQDIAVLVKSNLDHYVYTTNGKSTISSCLPKDYNESEFLVNVPSTNGSYLRFSCVGSKITLAKWAYDIARKKNNGEADYDDMTIQLAAVVNRELPYYI